MRLKYDDNMFTLIDHEGNETTPFPDNPKFQALLEARYNVLRNEFFVRNWTRREYFEMGTLLYYLNRNWELRRFEFAMQLDKDSE